MHVNEDHFIVETIDPETGKQLPEGSKGELVFTCLTKKAFPLMKKLSLNDNEKNFYLSDLDVRVICSDKMKLTSVQREILSKVINQEGE